jgi:hypothetical protein
VTLQDVLNERNGSEDAVSPNEDELRHHLRVCELFEIGLDRPQQEIVDNVAIFQDKRDPTAPGSVDSGNPHASERSRAFGTEMGHRLGARSNG